LLGTAVVLQAIKGILRLRKHPLAELGVWIQSLILFAAGLFLLPDSLILLNQKLDFSVPRDMKGRVVEIFNPGAAPAVTIEPDEGGSGYALKVSGEEYLNLKKRYTKAPPTYSLWQIENFPLSPRPSIVVFKVHRGLFGIKWQEKSSGYRSL